MNRSKIEFNNISLYTDALKDIMAFYDKVCKSNKADNRTLSTELGAYQVKYIDLSKEVDTIDAMLPKTAGNVKTLELIEDILLTIRGFIIKIDAMLF